MTNLTDKKCTEIVENYLNGNIKDARDSIKKLNKLQAVQFTSRCSDYGLDKHQGYTLVVTTLE